MAGQLTISTLSDGVNSTSATNPILGSAKAWVNFTGSTSLVNKSYNVSSITRNSAGNYIINFTTPMTSAYFCVALSSNDNGSGNASLAIVLASSVNSLTILTINPAGLGATDASYVGVTIFDR